MKFNSFIDRTIVDRFCINKPAVSATVTHLEVMVDIINPLDHFRHLLPDKLRAPVPYMKLMDFIHGITEHISILFIRLKNLATLVKNNDPAH